VANAAGPPARVDAAAPPPVGGRFRHRGTVRAVVLVVAGVLAGILVAVLVLQRHSSALVAPAPAGDRIPAAQAPSAFAPATVAGHLAPLDQHVPPVEVAVPAIGVRSGLVGLRLNTDGSLQVPSDYAQAGWYSQGPAPGDVGQPAVIVGHVDSTNGPAVFFKLRELHNGDPVLVRRADGTSVRFVVYRAAQYPKEGFPAQQVYAPDPDAELRLITCTGDFDRATGHYLGNYVVYAKQQTTK
jgi:hypothetical protein